MAVSAIRNPRVSIINGKSKSLFTMELSGEPYDRGFAYGEACKNLISRMIEEQFYKEFSGKLTKDQLLRHARKYEPFIREYSSEIADELKGMAEGSGRSYDEIVMLNALEERSDFGHSHCTAFAATGAATKTGETFAGQSWDGIEDEWWDGEMSLLFKVRRKNGPDILDYTNPGILACAGLNSNGIAVNWNTVPQKDMTPGVPTYIIVAEILKQKTMGEALDAARRASRAGYFNFVITDDTELYDVEATPGDLDISYSGEYIGHANHFVSEKFESTQNVGVTSCSIIRHNRMNRLLKENHGKMDLQTCMGFFRDHVNYPSSICCHPRDDPDPKERGLTLDAWISVPSKKEFWISHGSPCKNEFVRFGF
jgi:isopenicillin-N N-acyltransferase-like protein